MSDYEDFFLNSNSDVVQLETIEIYHPNFTQTYRIVRNAMNGITATLETGASVPFTFYPLQIRQASEGDDLDRKFQIVLGDLGDVLPKELDSVKAAGGFQTKPQVIYRTYRSDDLSKPLFGPLRFELANLNFNDQGVSFEAVAPKLNQLSTGELYTMNRFPMLKGFV